MRSAEEDDALGAVGNIGERVSLIVGRSKSLISGSCPCVSHMGIDRESVGHGFGRMCETTRA